MQQTHVLQNNLVRVELHTPGKQYSGSRFDWTGMVTGLEFHGVSMLSTEGTDPGSFNLLGRGLYNEFGMHHALGFEDTEPGGWFHKVGIGLLKKDSTIYNFQDDHEIRPAKFELESEPDSIKITCRSEELNGFAYILEKVYVLETSGLSIHYSFSNTGEKSFQTSEYVHNFLGFGNEAIGPDYELRFPFELKESEFGEAVNPEGKVTIGNRSMSFQNPPVPEFFFDHLNGSRELNAQWELINHKLGLGIRERASFRTDKVNLWGKEHVISPELFHHISLQSGDTARWTRTYELFEF
jgi:hypothetical protein